jgi:hypothetical protein
MKKENYDPTFEELSRVMNWIAPIVFAATAAAASVSRHLSIYDERFYIICAGFSLTGVSLAWIIATKIKKRKKMKNKDSQ